MALSYAFIIGTIEGSVAKCTPKDHPAIENAWIALDNVHFRAKFGNIRWSSPGVRIVCSTDDVKERRTVFNKSHIITAGGTISNLLVNLWPEETLRGAFGEFGLISYIIHSRRSRCKAVDIDSKITSRCVTQVAPQRRERPLWVRTIFHRNANRIHGIHSDIRSFICNSHFQLAGRNVLLESQQLRFVFP